MAINQIKNLEEFEELIKNSNNYCVIDFYADWCGPCKVMAPIFENISQSKELKEIKFIKIDRDKNTNLIKKYNFEIPTIPRFFLVKFNANGEFDKSNIIKELGGSQSQTDMTNQILEVLGKSKISLNSKEKETSKTQKVAIIGSGPSGLTAGIYTSRAQLDTTIYLGMQPGGQLTTTTEIENFPGAWNSETKQGMMGPDLMQLIQKQAEHFGAKTRLEEVKKIESIGSNKFQVTSSSGQETYDAVIIASGASARYLGLEGEEKFVGKGYHSCATCDGFFYRDKEIAVVGGGDSAMEEANFLTKFAKKVYLIHRRDEFKASKIMLERAKKNPKIEIMTFKKIIQFVGEEKIDYVILEDIKTGKKSELQVEGVFVAIGHIPNSGFIGNLLDKDKAGYLIPQWKVSPEYRVSKYDTATKIPGVFVAGDIEDTTYRQAITAAGDGCRAAMDTEKWLEEVGS